MLKRFIMTVAACVLSGPVKAAALGVCPSLALGTWVVERVEAPGITAMSDAESRSYIGKTVTVSQHEVTFARKRCVVTKQSVTYSFDALVDVRGFPFHVDYDCSNNVGIPVFSLGPRCDRIIAQYDGGIFYLRKAH